MRVQHVAACHEIGANKAFEVQLRKRRDDMIFEFVTVNHPVSKSLVNRLLRQGFVMFRYHEATESGILFRQFNMGPCLVFPVPFETCRRLGVDGTSVSGRLQVWQ